MNKEVEDFQTAKRYNDLVKKNSERYVAESWDTKGYTSCLAFIAGMCMLLAFIGLLILFVHAL